MSRRIESRGGDGKMVVVVVVVVVVVKWTVFGLAGRHAGPAVCGVRASEPSPAYCLSSQSRNPCGCL
jgi:hypothetical protein